MNKKLLKAITLAALFDFSQAVKVEAKSTSTLQATAQVASKV